MCLLSPFVPSARTSPDLLHRAGCAEFKRWAPGFKVVTYYGSIRERKLKRQGWTKPNAFHVCIVSYQLAVSDASVFRRKKWCVGGASSFCGVWLSF